MTAATCCSRWGPTRRPTGSSTRAPSATPRSATSAWSTLTSTSREYTLTGGGRIVAGRMIGPYLLVWTSDALWLGTYTGALDLPWRFERVGTKCGLIGPNAAIVVGQTAFWASPTASSTAMAWGESPAVLAMPDPQRLRREPGRGPGRQGRGELQRRVLRDPLRLSGQPRRLREQPLSSPWASPARRRGLVARDHGAHGLWSTPGRRSSRSASPTAGAVYYHETGLLGRRGPAGLVRSGRRPSCSIRTGGCRSTRRLARLQGPDGPDHRHHLRASIRRATDTQVTADPMAPDDMKADLLISPAGCSRSSSAAIRRPTYMRLGKPLFELERAGKL
jgi:hypothetical protein